LLPGLKAALLESPLSDTQASMDMSRGGKKGSKKEPAVSTYVRIAFEINDTALSSANTYKY
jgi:hypothetical protein